LTQPDVPPSVRIDVWLDVSCLFKTRSEAQRACKGGKIDVNGQRAKPHRELRLDDEIVITRSMGRKQRVVVRALVDTHQPKAEARKLYEDVTPPPSADELEFRRLLRRAGAGARGQIRPPSKRERRQLRRLKGQ
jgi:ribosome-associated heat shock protein Hsp15